MAQWKVIVVVRVGVVMLGCARASETRGLRSMVERGGEKRLGHMSGRLVGGARTESE